MKCFEPNPKYRAPVKTNSVNNNSSNNNNNSGTSNSVKAFFGFGIIRIKDFYYVLSFFCFFLCLDFVICVWLLNFLLFVMIIVIVYTIFTYLIDSGKNNNKNTKNNNSNNLNNSGGKSTLSNSKKKAQRIDQLFSDADGNSGYLKSEKDDEKFQV
jgi:hypothetical protein